MSRHEWTKLEIEVHVRLIDLPVGGCFRWLLHGKPYATLPMWRVRFVEVSLNGIDATFGMRPGVGVENLASDAVFVSWPLEYVQPLRWWQTIAPRFRAWRRRRNDERQRSQRQRTGE